MKIGNIQVNQVQSMGRRDLGAISGIDRAQQALKSADADVIKAAAGLVEQYATTKMEMNFDQNVSEAMDSLTEFKKNNAETPYYNAEDLKDLNLEGVRLYDPGNDDAGNDVQHLRKNIPAYEVYPALLSNKIKGVSETYSKNIISPKHRRTFDKSMTDYYRNQTLQALSQAQKAQVKQELIDTQKRAQAYAADGNKAAAREQLKLFKGSDKEKADLAKEINQLAEKNGYREDIRVEDVPALQKDLANLQADDYEKKGALTTDQNLIEQAKIRQKLGQLKARSTGIDGQYKAKVKETANDTIASMDDGIFNGIDSIKDLSLELSNLKLDDLALKLQRSAKSAPAVSAMYQTGTANHPKIIDDFVNRFSGVEKTAIRTSLIEKSEQVQRRVAEDGTGVYLERIVGYDQLPDINGDSYFAEVVNHSKRARQLYGIQTKPLPEKIAFQLADKLGSQTIDEKTNFIAHIASQVPDKADRDALFRQLDSQGAGNMNVYADMLERGYVGGIGKVDDGRKLRSDKTMNLLYKDIDSVLNASLIQVFPLPSERRNYIEATKDWYAADAASDGAFDPTRTDTDRVKNAMQAVVGNVVNYKGEVFLLPDNEVTGSQFNTWINFTSSRYIDELGGVLNMPSADVMKGIRNGDIRLKATGVRGEWKLTDVEGNALMTKDRAGTDGVERPIDFIFKYNKIRPKRIPGRPGPSGGRNQ